MTKSIRHRDAKRNRVYRYDDFLGDDQRRECVHGNYKRCSECEAEGEVIARTEEVRQWVERGAWFAGGFLACILIDLARVLLT